MIALALEEQAVEKAREGPVTPNFFEVKPAT